MNKRREQAKSESLALEEAVRWLGPGLLEPGEKHSLVCLPSAGGAAGMFYRQRGALDPAYRLLSVQPPGREQRLGEPPIQDLTALADIVSQLLLAHVPEPIALLGFSLGALVGFEVAHRLDQAGRCPSHLFVAAASAPEFPPTSPLLHTLNDQQLIAGLQRRYGAVPQPVAADGELMRLLLPAVRADLRCYERYVYAPRPPLLCPIVALGGRDDTTMETSALSAWRNHTRRAFDLHWFSGDHFFFKNRLDEVYQLVNRYLASPPDKGRSDQEEPQ